MTSTAALHWLHTGSVRNPPHNFQILSNYMFHLRSFTHIAVRQEYQFPFSVIFLLEEHEAKRSDLILMPGDTGYIQRLMNVCMKTVCVLCT